MATTRSSRTIKKPSRFLDDATALVEVSTVEPIVVPSSAQKKRVAGIMQRRGAKLLTSQEVPPPPTSKKRAVGSKNVLVFKEEVEEVEPPKKKARTPSIKKEKKTAEEVPAAAKPDPKPKKVAVSKKKDVAMANARLFEEVANRPMEEQLNAWKFAITKLKGEELKVLCKENNLMVKGSKIEIVERLSKSKLHGGPPTCDDCGYPKLEFKYRDTIKEPYSLMSLPYKIVCKHARGLGDTCGNSIDLSSKYYCSTTAYENCFAQPFRDAGDILASKDIPAGSLLPLTNTGPDGVSYYTKYASSNDHGRHDPDSMWYKGPSRESHLGMRADARLAYQRTLTKPTSSSSSSSASASTAARAAGAAGAAGAGSKGNNNNSFNKRCGPCKHCYGSDRVFGTFDALTSHTNAKHSGKAPMFR